MTLHEHGVGYHFIDEILFDYRVLPGSHGNKANNNHEVFSYLSAKHANTYREKLGDVARELKVIKSELEDAKSRPFRFFVRQQFYGLYKIYKNLKNGT